jgi:rRNA maturation RNase YbeY
VASRPLSRLTSWMMRQTNPVDPQRTWRNVTVVLVDDRGIAAIHGAVFARPGVTDVIACRYANTPGTPPGDDGEIVVNVEQALRHHGSRWSAQQELALYVAHGCDHLAGHDDADPAARQRMRRRELRWVRRAAAEGLLAELIDAP